MSRTTYDLRVPPEGWVEHQPVDGVEPPAAPKWSGGSFKLPAIGDRVTVAFNWLGQGTVSSYFVEYGWLGVRVELDHQPAWHRKQNPGRTFGLVFGNELAPPNDLSNIPAAACRKCGGWTSFGGCSQHSDAQRPVNGRTGCHCNR